MSYNYSLELSTPLALGVDCKTGQELADIIGEIVLPTDEHMSAVFQSCSLPLRRTLINHFGFSEEIPDIINESFQILYLRAGKTNDKNGRPLAPVRTAEVFGFLKKISFRLTIDQYRRKRNSKDVLNSEETMSLDEIHGSEERVDNYVDFSASIENDYIEKEAEKEIFSRLSKLTNVNERRVFALFLTDETPQEIAQSLDMGLPTVKSHIHRAREHMAKYFIEARY